MDAIVYGFVIGFLGIIISVCINTFTENKIYGLIGQLTFYTSIIFYNYIIAFLFGI